ncbi:hypothetical protein [Nostoc sp. CCY 9925]|uniref:hypothetical protein n=1 Tax=Nostoc sp. CCY 9925 TaxID=3103865 RepID=UPI0039C61841
MVQCHSRCEVQVLFQRSPDSYFDSATPKNVSQNTFFWTTVGFIGIALCAIAKLFGLLTVGARGSKARAISLYD